jgi:hypothetical protein
MRALENQMSDKHKHANHHKNRSNKSSCDEDGRTPLMAGLGSGDANAPDKSFAYKIADASHASPPVIRFRLRQHGRYANLAKIGLVP